MTTETTKTSFTATEVLNGAAGFAAKGHAITALLTQLQFDWGLQTQRNRFPRSAAQQPIHDAVERSRAAAGLATAPGPEVHVYNVENLMNGYAACYMLLLRHLEQKDPETNRAETFRERYCKTPGMILNDRAERQVMPQVVDAKAQCAKVGANPAKRIEVILADAKKTWESEVVNAEKDFTEALILRSDAEESGLVDEVLEVLTDEEEKPAELIMRAKNSLINTQKRRAEDGLFTRISNDIYSLQVA